MDAVMRSVQSAMALLWILIGLGAVHAVKVVIEPLPKGKYLENYERHETHKNRRSLLNM